MELSLDVSGNQLLFLLVWWSFSQQLEEKKLSWMDNSSSLTSAVRKSGPFHQGFVITVMGLHDLEQGHVAKSHTWGGNEGTASHHCLEFRHVVPMN